ncbi:hypothetical protein IQ782_09045 [Salipiger pacificus]|uniref:VPLPA-CTERM protein sorting domain-containing protein n=2 Tax=Salipiger mangrovisoli TaxID=2865933 RepID=A0ABR9X0H3_9RHOB|nr:hypothetical protein [Salipiger mangrovisoli]
MTTILSCAAFATTASAVTAVSISSYDALTYPGVDYAPGYLFEGFENVAGGPVIDASDSFAVGSFQTIGGVGSGSAVGALPCPNGTTLCIGSGSPVFGRQNIAPSDGDSWLDSNDTFGIVWDVFLGGTEFNALSFTMQDATDVGAYVTVISGSTTLDAIDGSAADGQVSATEVQYAYNNNLFGGALLNPTLPNGNIQSVTVTFGEMVTKAQIVIASFKDSQNGAYLVNDGIGIDGLMVGTLAPVPLPGGGLLLLGGLGALGFARQRRRA